MTTAQKLEKQTLLMAALDSYGCSFNRLFGIESEMQYTKQGAASTTISNDIDLKDVFEETTPIEGMIIANSWLDSGFNTPKYPVRIITFE
jgi:hypothetical protein